MAHAKPMVATLGIHLARVDHLLCAHPIELATEELVLEVVPPVRPVECLALWDSAEIAVLTTVQAAGEAIMAEEPVSELLREVDQVLP